MQSCNLTSKKDPAAATLLLKEDVFKAPVVWKDEH